MDGWRIRHSPAGDLSGDVGWFLGAVVLAGAILGAAAAFLWDKVVHHHGVSGR